MIDKFDKNQHWKTTTTTKNYYLNIFFAVFQICLCSLEDFVSVHCSEYCTSMVWVFPEEVCPYAKIVPLYPHRTSVRKTEWQVRPQHMCFTYLTHKDPGNHLYLSQSAWHRCCTPAPGWCWSETLDQMNRTSPEDQKTTVNKRQKI